MYFLKGGLLFVPLLISFKLEGEMPVGGVNTE